MRKSQIIPAVVLGALLLAACSSNGTSTDVASTGPASTPQKRLLMQKLARPPMSIALAPTSAPSDNLLDQGGLVMADTRTYAIWWGDPAAFPQDAERGLDALLEGIGDSPLLGVSTQYLRGATPSSTFAANWTDGSTSPATSPPIADVGAEVCNSIHANGAQPDPQGVYLAVASSFPSDKVSYCAWHSWALCDGQRIHFVYLPNPTGVAGCDPGDAFACNSYSPGTRAMVNLASHELVEVITNADGDAWSDTSGGEIGDKCAWQFQRCEALPTGSWQLQEEWSNAAHGCVP
jgi:predicted small secreted protein